MNSYTEGKLAEFCARLYMRLHGWRIVARNYKGVRGTKAGEIDFVAVCGKQLAFVEVKKRCNPNEAAYAIGLEQQKRIVIGAKRFLRQYPIYAKMNLRFDAVLISLPFYVRHIPNAWQADCFLG